MIIENIPLSESGYWGNTGVGVVAMAFGAETTNLIIPKNGFWEGYDPGVVSYQSYNAETEINDNMNPTVGEHTWEVGVDGDQFTFALDGYPKDI